MGHGRVLVAVVGVLLAFPGAAWGQATLSRDGPSGVITFAGTNGVDSVTLDNRNDNTAGGVPGYGFTGPQAIMPSNGCFTNSSSEPICPAAGSTSVVFNMLGGNDFVEVEITAGLTPLPTTINGGAGNDTLDAGTMNDTVNGDAGHDVIRMYTGGGTANGGDGNDRFEHIEGPAVVIGGPGRDGVLDDGNVALVASLDGIANDSLGANFDPSIEDITGTFLQNDTLVGSASANRLIGRGGNDSLDGKDGADDLQGGDGDDTIEARDGVVDTVDCGDGTGDTANVDFRDNVTNCETVNRAARDDDRDGSSPPADCNDANASIKPGAGEIPNNGVDEDCSGADATVDADGDGAVPPADCDDTNPARRPGLRDRPKNNVDENCDGKDADWRVNRARIANNWIAFTGYTLVDNLRLRGLPARARATVKCSGRGCPFKKAKRLRIRNRRANATKLFKGDRLRPGARITIRITAPETIGKIVRYTIRSRKLPAKRELCDPPGRQRPARC